MGIVEPTAEAKQIVQLGKRQRAHGQQRDDQASSGPEEKPDNSDPCQANHKTQGGRNPKQQLWTHLKLIIQNGLSSCDESASIEVFRDSPCRQGITCVFFVIFQTTYSQRCAPS